MLPRIQSEGVVQVSSISAATLDGGARLCSRDPGSNGFTTDGRIQDGARWRSGATGTRALRPGSARPERFRSSACFLYSRFYRRLNKRDVARVGSLVVERPARRPPPGRPKFWVLVHVIVEHLLSARRNSKPCAPRRDVHGTVVRRRRDQNQRSRHDRARQHRVVVPHLDRGEAMVEGG